MEKLYVAWDSYPNRATSPGLRPVYTGAILADSKFYPDCLPPTVGKIVKVWAKNAKEAVKIAKSIFQGFGKKK
jgi:hypothetical protein